MGNTLKALIIVAVATNANLVTQKQLKEAIRYAEARSITCDPGSYLRPQFNFPQGESKEAIAGEDWMRRSAWRTRSLMV